MGEFRPLDIHPCTVNEKSWHWEVGIENLFGELCSGSTFAHDIAMMREAEDQDHLSKPRTARGRLHTALVPPVDYTSRHLTEPIQYSAGPNSITRYSSAIDRSAKRRCHNALSVETENESNKAKQSLSGLNGSYKIKRSFEGYQQRSRLAMKLPTQNKVTPDRTLSSSLFQIASDGTTTSTRETMLPQGTQAKPIEVSDEISSSAEGSDTNDDGEGDFLLNEMPGPNDLEQSSESGHSGLDTQISLSDREFESQSSRHAADRKKITTLQRRQAAYTAVKAQNVSPVSKLSVLSLLASHRDFLKRRGPFVKRTSNTALILRNICLLQSANSKMY